MVLTFPGTFLGDVATEFSDVILAQSFKMNEAMNLTVGNQTCQAGPFPLPKRMIPMDFRICLYMSYNSYMGMGQYLLIPFLVG